MPPISRINSVDAMLAESLDGFAAAHRDIVALGPERKFVRRRSPRADKVALISGGGSGHEPLHAGFVGTGMLDAACPGQIFTSPTPDQIVEAATAVGGKAGVLFIVKNYAGDCMNFEMAAESFEGPAANVITNDDVAVERSTHSSGRRGVAGTLIVEKIVGATAERGLDLRACAELGVEVNARTRSIGVALSSCTVPAAGSPTFSLSADEMEMGVGIHGEPGRKRVKLATADAIADEMLGAIFSDGDVEASDGGLLLVNGFGGTPAIELYLMYNAARRILEKRGFAVRRSLVGSYGMMAQTRFAKTSFVSHNTALSRQFRSLVSPPPTLAADAEQPTQSPRHRRSGAGPARAGGRAPRRAGRHRRAGEGAYRVGRSLRHHRRGAYRPRRRRAGRADAEGASP
jgi:dihydroxyacetone kinase-like protein